MQDRFKFRVWDKDAKIYQSGICLEQSGKVTSNSDRYEIEQCTGLKDKNGKLIYENDVVKDDENQKLTVIFKNGCFYLSNGRCGMTIDQFYINKYEIIGNIHANPELMVQK